MNITLELDDDLPLKARALTGINEQEALLREALTALIRRESARRLSLPGRTEPGMEHMSRRRLEPGQ
jgi:hypothetical protein